MKDYDARRVVKDFLKENNETLVHVCELMNANHPDDVETSQNLTNKLLRNSIRFSKVMEIADVLGYEICFRKIESEDNIPEPHTEEETPLTVTPHKPTRSEAYEQVDRFLERIETPFTIIEGNRFRKILIIGVACQPAAELLSRMIEENRKKERADINDYEILACAFIEASFDVIIYPNDCKENGDK